jgi:hypothetical protein
MSRRFGLVLGVLGMLAVVPVALGAYPTPLAVQGGQGVMSSDGTLRFVATKAAEGGTVVSAISTRDGSVVKSQPIDGSFGVPSVTYKGPAAGMLRDGSAFVLQSTGYRPQTSFQVVRTSDLASRTAFTLKGTFAFDALSPDGSKLYLIQHTSSDDLQHYVVRRYDLTAGKLMPGKIADKTQKGWVMQGFPAARATTADGRWVYTLYWNPNGYPFVHALDTVRGVAHCVGIAAPAQNGAVLEYTIRVQGQKLVIRTSAGSVYRVIDRRTWRVTKAL